VIDIHSHLLVGLDDGCRSVTRSVEVLDRMREDGVEAVVLTPHLKASEIARDGDAHYGRRAAAFLELSQRASEAPMLHLGFEIMLDQPLAALAMGDRRFSVAGSHYYLVEFPLTVVAEFATRVLAQMAEAGSVPIVAHPERYDACSPDTVRQWRCAGAKMQLDATAITRPTSRGRRARALLAEGLADLVAADNHGDNRTIATASNYLTRHGREEAARILTAVNPAAVLDGRAMVDVPPAPVGESWWGKVRRFVSG
jgi:protein-tyrosine phosphatase